MGHPYTSPDVDDSADYNRWRCIRNRFWIILSIRDLPESWRMPPCVWMWRIRHAETV